MRAQNLPILPPVDTFTVAPHRYRYDRDEAPQTTWKETKAASPYKVGEVIYVAYGDSFVRAYIHALTCRRDCWDDLREAYEVRRETKAGVFAKRTYTTYPGLVQRGYYLAGLAPEIPAGVF